MYTCIISRAHSGHFGGELILQSYIKDDVKCFGECSFLSCVVVLIFTFKFVNALKVTLHLIDMEQKSQNCL